MPKKKITEEAMREIPERPEAEETAVSAGIPPEDAVQDGTAAVEGTEDVLREEEKEQPDGGEPEIGQSFLQSSSQEDEAPEDLSVWEPDEHASGSMEKSEAVPEAEPGSADESGSMPEYEPEEMNGRDTEPEAMPKGTEIRTSEDPYDIDSPAAVSERSLPDTTESEHIPDGNYGETDSSAAVSGSPAQRAGEVRLASTGESDGDRPENQSAGDERRAFYDLDFNELDRDLSPEQRQEWNSIYASYRGRNAMSGTIVGIDRHRLRVRDRKTGEMTSQQLYCAIVIPFRVRILIPETELWMRGEERPDYVIRNLAGAKIDFVIIHVDREAGFAVGSRRLALPSRRYYFSAQPSMNSPGSRVNCEVLVVGPRRCLVSCHGYDMDLSQRELSYTAIPDLREIYHSGQNLNCVVKAFDREAGRLSISVKETVPNPYDGAAFRHPVQSHRQGVIAGKYGGGVFCNLPDGVTVMCSYSFHYDDSAFHSGDRVMLIIQRYDDRKKQIYGKIVAKC